LLARLPGGSFQVLSVGRDVAPSEVAAAPGGWGAVVGERIDARPEVVATIVAPNGTSWSAVVDRGRAAPRSYHEFDAPHVGIDARGRATAAWTRWRAATGRYDLRTASSTDGRTWTPARTLAATRKRTTSSHAFGQVDVAVAPAGPALLAWADGRGVHATVDGGPVERLTAAPTSGSPTASIADDGTAVVAYSDRRWRLFANDRGRDGRWSAPRELAGADDGPPGFSEAGGAQETALESVIAPDGRAVVAWPGSDLLGERIFATSAVGGVWTAAAPLSLPTRDADQAALSLGDGGDPRVLWLEARSPDTYRPRVSRLVSDATLQDTTPPAVTARLPARARRVFRVAVGCSEACDVRLSLRTTRGGFDLVSRLRELAAGETATLRVRAPTFGRRAWLHLFVSDRSGNVTRVARRVTFARRDPSMD
jgi:hypothetical protein